MKKKFILFLILVCAQIKAQDVAIKVDENGILRQNTEYTTAIDLENNEVLFADLLEYDWEFDFKNHSITCLKDGENRFTFNYSKSESLDDKQWIILHQLDGTDLLIISYPSSNKIILKIFTKLEINEKGKGEFKMVFLYHNFIPTNHSELLKL